MYKNGIRVQPGGKDWLNLDRDKAKKFDSMMMIFRSSQVIAMANYNIVNNRCEINPQLKHVQPQDSARTNQSRKSILKIPGQVFESSSKRTEEICW